MTEGPTPWSEIENADDPDWVEIWDALEKARPYVVRALAQDEMRAREGKPGGMANAPIVQEDLDEINAALARTGEKTANA